MIHLAVINIIYNTFYKFNCIYENYMVLQEAVKILTVKRNYKIQYEISYSQKTHVKKICKKENNKDKFKYSMDHVT